MKKISNIIQNDWTLVLIGFAASIIISLKLELQESFFSLVGIVFLIVTLKDQKNTSYTEKFENHFFALLQMHRDNVSEIGIKERSGRRIFVTMIRELRIIVNEIKKYTINQNIVLEADILYGLSFTVFYYGTGTNSNRQLLNAIKKSYSMIQADHFIQYLKDNYKSFDPNSSIPYKVFEGHQSRLKHYYAHMFQTIKYIDKNKVNGNEYASIFKAQLSTHELALLVIQSLSPQWQNWKYYIKKYDLLDGLSESFFDENTEIVIKRYLN